MLYSGKDKTASDGHGVIAYRYCITKTNQFSQFYYAVIRLNSQDLKYDFLFLIFLVHKMGRRLSPIDFVPRDIFRPMRARGTNYWIIKKKQSYTHTFTFRTIDNISVWAAAVIAPLCVYTSCNFIAGVRSINTLVHIYKVFTCFKCSILLR